MQHAVLGIISLGDSGDATATIRYRQRPIQLSLCGDGEPLESAIGLAAAVVRQLVALDEAAKDVAVLGLLETYNGGWNEYDVVQPDGSLQTVINPELSESEFKAKLSLVDISVTGTSVITFSYDDQNMFWGHSVIVSSLEGLDFSDARAELFG